jgi:putative transposase
MTNSPSATDFLDVPKLGRVNMAEKVRFAGKMLSARISKTAAWWFVSITVEMPDDLPLNTYPPVGIDVGLNRLATLSDGRQYENQRPLVHRLKKLRRLNKELARRTKDGKNWLKTKDKLSRAHYEIACIRLDWLHKHTTEIATTSGIVAVEDLHVKGLIRNRCLSRSFFGCSRRHTAGSAREQSGGSGQDAAQGRSLFSVQPAVSLLRDAQNRCATC